MLTKRIASFLVFTVTLLTVPATSFAQTQHNSAADQYLRDAQTKRAADLKASFAAEMARIKAGTLTKADLERIQTASQNTQAPPRWPKRDKIFLAVFIVATTALVWYLIKHPCKVKEPGDCEFIDNSY